MNKLKVLDLFSGIGGFSLGLDRTGGFETAAFCEFDQKARLVLQKHWPDVPMFDDVRTLTKEKLDEQGISVDVICGGFPCQDISLAGKGAGLAGERSGLWFEFHRIIKEIRPSWVIAENVSALRSRGLDTVLGSLTEIGYDAEWHCIPASAIGAPHRRDRIWIIAYPNSDSINWGSESQLSDNSGGETICDELSGLRAEMADTQSDGWQQRNEKFGRRSEGTGAREKLRFGDGSEIVADSSSAGLPQRGRSEWQTSAEETGTRLVSESERCGQDVADTESRTSWNERQDERSSGGEINTSGNTSCFGGGAYRPEYRETLADANDTRLQGRQETGNFSGLWPRLQQFLERCPDSIWSTWAIEPDVGRVAHGVPKRVDRLKQLGNAVVPQIPELIGYAILEKIKNGTP